MKKILLCLLACLCFVFLCGAMNAFSKNEGLAAFPDEVRLPEGSAPASESVPHFPDRIHTYVWRNWNLIDLDKLAKIVGATPAEIEKTALSMGLPAYRKPVWTTEQIYITLIRRNWHLLPYEQILQLVEMTPAQLNHVLREDDFLWVKLGLLKPKCEPLYYEPPTQEALARAEEIRLLMKEINLEKLSKKQNEPRFAFIDELKSTGNRPSSDIFGEGSPALRFIYPYFALFGDPLMDNNADIFPDGLLEKLSALGVNGVWLHVLLRDLAPGGQAFPEFGKGSEQRLKNLAKAVERAKKFNVDVYLYMNEPRAMPQSFFADSPVSGREQTRGVCEGDYCALCTSNPDVRNWMKDALSHVFTEVPRLGGVFTISGSENLTFCNSHGGWQQCPRCREKSGAEIVADANALIAEGVHRAAPHAKVIVWDWGWNGHGYATDIIEKLPDDVWLMSVSEWALQITRGGVHSTVGEYSISSVGPGPRAKAHWKAAQERGLKTAAKVQFNCTWEMAAVPFIPVMDLIAEHCSNLATSKVDGFLLSWTLGGYPSPNLEIPQKFDRIPVPSQTEALDELAKEYYGEKGFEHARKAWTLMSNAYREYPYGGGIYTAPTQMGPANLFRPRATGYRATMVNIPYDDLNAWRGNYPAEIFAQQFEKMAVGFAEAIPVLEKAVSYARKDKKAQVEAELRYAKTVRIHFASVANQIQYIMLRDEYNSENTSQERKKELSGLMRPIIENEMNLAKELYALTLEDSRIGFESTNHYFYVPNDLLEKWVNCRHILDSLK